MKRLLWISAALGLLIFFAFSWTPFFIRHYIEKNYPGLSVGDAALRWQFVVLNNVTINRANLKGLIPVVTVDWDKNVVLYGGKIEATLTSDVKTSAKSKEAQSVQGQDLDIDVTKDDAKAILKGVSFDSSTAIFKSGEVSYGNREASILEGSVSIKDKILRAKQVRVPIVIPFNVPRLDPKQVIEINDVLVDVKDKSVTFASSKMAAIVQTQGSSKAYILEKSLKLELAKLVVNHPWISPEAVTFSNLEALVPLEIVNGKGVISTKIGMAEILIDPSKMHIEGKGSCNAWVEAMPEPMATALDEAKGHFSGDLSFDITKDPAPQLKIKNTCKFDCKADPVQRLREGRVTYMAYDKNDKLFERVVGPRGEDWVPLANLPPQIPNAFITLEDPGFNSHRGVIAQALENSFKDNLRMGRFFRGGSTISMQLAKNLWLRRHKTLGRKTQEVLLTLALESCLSKAEILELYLNVVEFGPNLYGIGPASKFYFDHPPERLEIDEAFYLASILPRPRKAIPPKQGGLERTRSLMRTLAGRGLINETLVPLESSGDDSGWVTE